jgi:hypothetical protein
MCLEASKCMDVGEGIMSVNTNLLTEEERVLHSLNLINLFENGGYIKRTSTGGIKFILTLFLRRGGGGE